MTGSARLWTVLAILLFAPPPAAFAQAATTLDTLVATYALAPQDVGFLVFDPETGSVLEEHNADQGFIPASVTKVPTMVAAMNILGADYRFETTVQASGPVAGGHLGGDLFLVGGGNPFLDTGDLAGLAREVRARGIATIDGALHYDASLLASVEEINAGQPIPADYNPGVSALSVNFNRILVSWQRDRSVGGVVALAKAVSDSMEMPVDWVSFDPAPAETDPGAGFVYAGMGGVERWLVSQRLSEPGTLWLPVRAPDLHTATVFARLLEQQGVTVGPPTAGVRPAAAVALALNTSPPLVEIAEQVLHYSNNLSAELVGLAASRQLTGTAMSLPASSQALGQWYAARIPSIAWGSFRTENHSGLSTSARVTPRQLGAVLHFAWPQVYGGQRLFDLLQPVAWQDAINQERPAGSPPLQIRAKTGTVYYGSGLAGYLTTVGGRTLGFVVFVSDIAQRTALDAVMDRRFLAPPEGGRGWLSRAREVERALVTRWATAY
ncbi:MAG: D-alanyl-D-alanine carboxypeptidase/D-alanyl-D-alanine-endopeptidase [Rhodospirillaceae bacterium]|nr:D-alanyl-D-alanine carboxypeptidase/D-alanyl-D-alanine-endopeptidase [Rhodospirillaceae bacterium]